MPAKRRAVRFGFLLFHTIANCQKSAVLFHVSGPLFLRFRVSGGTGKLWELSAASGEEGTAVCGDRRKKIYGKRKGSGAD